MNARRWNTGDWTVALVVAAFVAGLVFVWTRPTPTEPRDGVRCNPYRCEVVR